MTEMAQSPSEVPNGTKSAPPRRTLLTVLNRTRSDDKVKFIPFYLKCPLGNHQDRSPEQLANVPTPPIGMLRPEVAQQLWKSDVSREKQQLLPRFEFYGRPNEIWAVAISDWLDKLGRSGRSEHMQALTKELRDQGLYKLKEIWTDELSHVYSPPIPDRTFFEPFSNVAFSLPRRTTHLFGLTQIGVNANGYTRHPSGEIMLWIPLRAENKDWFPSHYDSTVAGGLTAGISPLECLIKECHEEASLTESFVKPRLRPAGCVTSVFKDSGWVYPEFDYIYDLELPWGVQPRPNDGEVQHFQLLPTEHVISLLFDFRFSVDSAHVWIDFLIRHGYVTPENEPNYLEVCSRLRLTLPNIPCLW